MQHSLSDYTAIFAEITLARQIWTGGEIDVKGDLLFLQEPTFNEFNISDKKYTSADVVQIQDGKLSASGRTSRLAVGRFIGGLVGYPSIKTNNKKSQIKKKNINGKWIVDHLSEALEIKLDFKNYPQNGDQNTIATLHQQANSIYLWSNITSTNPHLNRALHHVHLVGNDDTSTYKNYHQLPLFNASLHFLETQ